MRKINPFTAARTPQQEERDKRQKDSGPLAGVEAFAEDQQRSDQHHDGTGCVNRAYDGDGQMFQPEIA